MVEIFSWKLLVLFLGRNLPDIIKVDAPNKNLYSVMLISIFQGSESEWRIIFFICAGVIISGTLFYLFVAEGEVQDWAKPKRQINAAEEEGISMLENKRLNLEEKEKNVESFNNNPWHWLKLLCSTFHSQKKKSLNWRVRPRFGSHIPH